MEAMQLAILILSAAAALAAAGALIVSLAGRKASQTKELSALPEQIQRLRTELSQEIRQVRQENAQEIRQTMQAMGELLANAQSQSGRQLLERQQMLQQSVADMLHSVDEKINHFTLQNEQKMGAMRETMERRLTAMQADNTRQLEQMRATVDEKLQKTLEERIGQSFQLVSERLEQVYKGLGEMQTLASGVGDLKKVLSNVKTRGVLGEIQLGAILEEILAPEQYEANVKTKPGSSSFVEYAVKLPGDDESVVYLPIDAKFPTDAYSQLLDAYEEGDRDAVKAASAVLEQRIKLFARDIRDKYIDPPHTTDFGVMFLPLEGLYAEVVRLGMVEVLQRDYKVSIAGPTTMAALLNSLQMGFKTLAIQKRSSEVWDVLSAAKTQFDKFAEVLAAAQKRLVQVNDDLDKLVGTRTNVIRRTLRAVSTMSDSQSAALLGVSEQEEEQP